MPLMMNVYNTTLEDFKTQFNSKGYRFKARSLTKLPEEFIPFLDQYAKQGLVVVKAGDDLQAKEREGLINYLGFINERLSYFNLYLDEKKRNGVTVENPRDMEKLKQWKSEIIAKLELHGALEEIPSFDSAPKADAETLFKSEVEVKTLVEKKKPGRPAKSFADVNIEDEIG